MWGNSEQKAEGTDPKEPVLSKKPKKDLLDCFLPSEGRKQPSKYDPILRSTLSHISQLNAYAVNAVTKVFQ
jgi:hypothetical protein